jgi:hypothetical protein
MVRPPREAARGEREAFEGSVMRDLETRRDAACKANHERGAARRAVASLAVLCALLLASPARAADLGSEDRPPWLEAHGFASQGFILTLKNDYLAEKTKDGSFEFSELGINFTKDLTESLRMGVQFFAQDLGQSGNYKPVIDWFYLDYRWQNWLGFRAGRLKIPYGLHNEIQDVDSARVPVLLPQSVYPLQARQFLFAQTGAELYGFARFASLGALDYRLFAGTIFIDADSLTPAGTTFDVRFHVPYVAGGRLLWETPLEGLRLGGSAEALRLETTAFVPGIAPIEITNHSWLWVVSAEYGVDDLMLTAEYSRWDTRQRSNAPALSPPIRSLSERAYVMATYRITPWLQPGAYYSVLFPNVYQREGRENRQHDWAATLRFDINRYWLVKLEGHYLAGTAGLDNPLRLATQNLAAADRYWAAFLLKTTAYF